MSRNDLFMTVFLVIAVPLTLLAHGKGHGRSGHHGKKGHAPAPHHGGKVLVSGDHAFEVIFEDGGVHLFPMDAEGVPLKPTLLSGKVTLRARRGKPMTLPLEAVKDSQGKVLHLMARRDLSKIRDGSRKAVFQLKGMGTSKPISVSAVLRRTPGFKAGSGSGHDMAGSHSAGSHSDHDMAGSHSAKDAAGSGSARSSKADAALAAQRKAYPLDWCVVTGDKLGSDGPPVDHVHQGRLVRLCCEGCVELFEKSPGKYLRMLDSVRSGKSVSRPAGSHSAHGGHDH